MKRGVLIVMARAPRFGAVKTRLAQDIGALNAWRFYRNTLASTVNRLSRRAIWSTALQVTPDRDVRPRRQWPSPARLLSQGHGDLGARIERGLTSSPRGVPVVLIGSDIPGITPQHIRDAFKALGRSDAVFGPAADGGYWLIGFANRRPIKWAFSDVRWSTAHALTDTQANIRNKRIAFVRTMSDVDDGESYEGIRRQSNQRAIRGFG
ncbi:MAG: TIGR04282 family arsenosugar biosynthesis glycosyltransferase [Rhodospirillaceae bacterium]|nr:TIGR04282 family arsenosugar biosynthesis glycosyltransferase [Rhodospirillaceae bacterium]